MRHVHFGTHQRHRLTVADYHLIGKAGVISEADRVELIEGEMIDRAPIGSAHAAVVRRLVRLFDRRIGEQAIVSAQNPIWLSEYSEPEPDIALLRYREDFFRHAHPRPEDVLLIVEVADSSLRCVTTGRSRSHCTPGMALSKHGSSIWRIVVCTFFASRRKKRATSRFKPSDTLK